MERQKNGGMKKLCPVEPIKDESDAEVMCDSAPAEIRPVKIVLVIGVLVLLLGLLTLTVVRYVLRDEIANENGADRITEAYLNGELGDFSAEGYTDGDPAALDYMGEIGCVLQIPKIGISRCVIEGDFQTYNLDRFLFTTATASMHYDKASRTNYCICGHNSYVYGFSMNRLDEMEVGDAFYILTADGAKYEYVVYEIVPRQFDFSDSDLDGEDDIVSIYTCCDQKTEPKPYLIVRGKYQRTVVEPGMQAAAEGVAE